MQEDNFLATYVAECTHYLETVEADLLEMEALSDAVPFELVNRVFRAAHSIKGGAGFFELRPVKELAQKLENVLEMVRSGGLVPNPEVISQLLQGFDKMKLLFANIGSVDDVDVGDEILALTGLASSYLPPDKKQQAVVMSRYPVPGSRLTLQAGELLVDSYRSAGNGIALLLFDLIHDVQRLGKQPRELLAQIADQGMLLDCGIDIFGVGSLDQDTVADRVPFYALLSTSKPVKALAEALGIDPENVQFVELPSFDLPLKNKTKITPEPKSRIKEEPKLASSDLLVVVGDESFAVPEDSVVETLRIRPGEVKDRIGRLGDRAMLNLRGSLIPLVKLAEVLGVLVLDRRQRLDDRRLPDKDGASPLLTEGRTGKDRRLHVDSDVRVAVIRSAGLTYALVVDELHETTQIVVKPLGSHFSKLKEYSGAATLESGATALVLDTAGLAARAGLTVAGDGSRAKGEPFMAVTCQIGGTMVGIDSAFVEEIVRLGPLTPVHGASAWVLGIVGLRGRTVTVLDLARKMGQGITRISDETRVVIVKAGPESVGLLVPRLSEVEVDPTQIKNVADRQDTGSPYLGLFEHNGQLLALLDVARAVQAP